MSNDIKRETAGTADSKGKSAGGRFAKRFRDDNGTTLTKAPAVPEWGAERRAELQAEIAVHGQRISDLNWSDAMLSAQATEAHFANLQASTAREVRETAADVAELAFLRETVHLETTLAGDDLNLALARRDVDRGSDAVIRELMLTPATSDRAGVPEYRSAAIHALDLETDMGAGHIGWHPWHSEVRAQTIRELNDLIEAMPESADEPLWTERLLQLGDPFRVRRVELQVRRNATEANLAQLAFTRAAEKANSGLRNDQQGAAA